MKSIPHNNSNNMGFYFTILAFLTFLLLVFLKASGFFEKNTSVESINGIRTLRLEASDDHHYRIEGSINGIEVTFLLDTGATGIAVSANIADQAGLERGGHATMQTANGDVEANASRIARLEIGPILMKNMPAWIMPDMDDEVLLGMSVLRQFNWRQEDGTLLIEIPE